MSDNDVWAPRISEAALAKMARIGAAVLGVLVAVGAFALAALWAQAGDRGTPGPNAADLGFLQDMIDHHEQALLISRTYLQHNGQGGAAPYAREVITFQTWEIERMERWLAKFGLGRGRVDRKAMVWMGMDVLVSAMPGIQTQERIEQLAAASGSAADRLWFEMMKEHHRGGAHMASGEVALGQRSDIRSFADKMAYSQSIEIVEYAQAQRRLGL